MARAQLRHGVVADPRQVEPDVAGREVLDRRIGQRDDLAIVTELVHLAETLIEIEQLFDAAQPRPDIAELRPEAAHLLEELVREDVAVDVDDRVVGHGESPDHTLGVMAGLVPAIHVFATAKKDVDARDKPGHDVERF